MPHGNCAVRFQNSSGATLTRLDYTAQNAVWNQVPPQTLAPNAQANVQVAYNFPDNSQSDFAVRYTMPQQNVPFTGSAIVDQVHNVVTVTGSGAGPGAHETNVNVIGAAPAFTVLITFS
jgi:hypothetical protein